MTVRASHYSMLIRWSDEDQLFLVSLPEWEGALGNWDSATHGDTYEAAAANGHEVLTMLIEHRLESRRRLPEPQVFADARTSTRRVPA